MNNVICVQIVKLFITKLNCYVHDWGKIKCMYNCLIIYMRMVCIVQVHFKKLLFSQSLKHY